MPSESEQLEYWGKKAIEDQRGMLESVQASAGKWQAAIAAFLGAFVTAGFVWGPEKLEKFPLTGDARLVCLLILFSAGIAGVVAILFANLASQGVPRVREGHPVGAVARQKTTTRRTQKAATQLKIAIIAAGGAGALVLFATGWILGAAATKAPPSGDIHATLLTDDGAYCGTLESDQGVLVLKLPNDAGTVAIDGGELEIIEECPD